MTASSETAVECTPVSKDHDCRQVRIRDSGTGSFMILTEPAAHDLLTQMQAALGLAIDAEASAPACDCAIHDAECRGMKAQECICGAWP